MTVATALAVSWKPLTNSQPSAISVEQQEWHYRSRAAPRGLDVGIDRIGHEEQRAGDDGEIDQQSLDTHRLVELYSCRRRTSRWRLNVGNCGHRRCSPKS